MLCGGTSELKRPDDEANRVLDVVKTSLLTKTGHDADDDGELPLSIFRISILFSVELLGYKSQVVAGTNYFLKVSLVGGGIGMWLKLNLFFNRLKMH